MLGSIVLKWRPRKFYVLVKTNCNMLGPNLTVLKRSGLIFFNSDRESSTTNIHSNQKLSAVSVLPLRHWRAKRNCILTTRRRIFQVRTKLQQAVWPTKRKLPCPLPKGPHTRTILPLVLTAQAKLCQVCSVWPARGFTTHAQSLFQFSLWFKWVQNITVMLAISELLC